MVHETVAGLIADCVIGIYGIFVGNLGLRSANSMRTTGNDGRRVAFNLQVYYASHTILMFAYIFRILIFSALNGSLGASFIIVFYVASCFMMCSIQIIRAKKVVGSDLMPKFFSWRWRTNNTTPATVTAIEIPNVAESVRV